MNPKNLLFCLFTLIHLSVFIPGNTIYAQDQKVIIGSVIDANTKEVLPFTSITLKKSLIGTATNEDGIFEIKFSSEIIGDSLFVALLGYKSNTQPLNAIKDTILIALQKSEIELKEIVVRPLPPTYYIKQAMKNLKETNPKDPFQTEAYYREIVMENDNYIVSNEAVFKSYYPNFQDTIKNQHQVLLYRKANEIKEMSFMKERREKKVAKKQAQAKKKGKVLTDEERKGLAANFGGLEQILKQADLSKSEDEYLDSTSFKHYNYNFASSSSYDNKILLVIDFKSKGNINHVRQSGKIYIDIASNAIVKVEEYGDFVIPIALRPILFLYGFSIDKPKYESIKLFQCVNTRWYPKNVYFNMSADFTKTHWFEPDEHSSFSIEGVFNVNKIKINGTQPITKEKRFVPSKKIEPQVFNDEKINWSDVNIIKK